MNRNINWNASKNTTKNKINSDDILIVLNNICYNKGKVIIILR